jgi:hypothetical protein
MIGGGIYTVIQSLTEWNATEITVNLGSGLIHTNYSQAYSLCAGPFGQKAIAASQAVAVTCHNVGNISAECNLGIILGIIVGIIFGIVVTGFGIARLIHDYL